MAKRDDGLPPPSRKGRMGPEMMDEDPAIVSKLSQLAEQEGRGGGMMGGGGSEEQSAQLLMQGAQALMQAAQMNPALQQFVGQAVQILQQGVQQMAGGGAGGELGGGLEEGGRGGGRRRIKPPKSERGAEEDQFTY